VCFDEGYNLAIDIDHRFDVAENVPGAFQVHIYRALDYEMYRQMGHLTFETASLISGAWPGTGEAGIQAFGRPAACAQQVPSATGNNNLEGG